jgi:tetratricopeptide (TPR) repeat protein
MKNYVYILSIIILFISCTSQKNSEDFINKTTGRYLFNANEVLEIYFEDGEMHAKWRGNDDIKLLKVNDSAFYMQELNEKMLFVSKPQMHIKLAEKVEHDGQQYYFEKMNAVEKTANEYFKAKEYDKAKEAYLTIQKKDSSNFLIEEYKINRLGYQFVRKNENDKALELFKINAALYPKSSNVYNSLGEAYFLQKDTLNAIVYFKKSLEINSENKNSKKFLEKLTKK